MSTHNMPHPLWRLGFRPFFLFAALFSVLAIGWWGGMLSGFWGLAPYGGSYFWHGHEMLFGFTAAVIVGFLLTAVQNWTGVPGINGWPLILLFSTWLTGRVVMLVNPPWPESVVAILDMLFLPLAAGFMAWPLIKVRQQRNLFFVPVLLIMAAANFMTHLTVLGVYAEGFHHGSYLMLMLITALICVIGGRVTPMFTANGTGTQKVSSLPWLDKSALASIWLLVFHWLFGGWLPDEAVGIIAMVAGVLHFFRWIRWRVWVTFSVPLLWSLHLAYLFVPLGLLALSGHYLGDMMPLSTAIHLLTTGAIGSIIVAMMARVSLGHTGRKLHAHWLMSIMFVTVLLAGLVRTLGSWLWHSQIQSMLLLSTLLWCFAFILFVLIYLPILTRPRIDGKPG
ncbi:NnrS family protein [Lacimicrobium sp. SS2-24]|uniref:NnrS family protein n=1 Tax=Lacimicrobium sp. SS2-24 TaxID=2005569 RepID=UPI000B4C0AC2|nr:NnrS family protein [Lacimicrobium sp. SS2-24]